MAHRLAGSYLQETTCELLNILFAYAFNDVSDWPQWALALATLYSLCYFYYPCLPGITNQSLLVAACNFVVLDRHPAALLLSAASQTTDLSMESRSWITCRQCTPPPKCGRLPPLPPPPPWQRIYPSDRCWLCLTCHSWSSAIHLSCPRPIYGVWPLATVNWRQFVVRADAVQQHN